MNKKIVEVAVGVIVKAHSVFICKRRADQHQGGLWEFPGGKVESEESIFDALKRELKEEVDIDIQSSSPLTTIEHDYGDKCVRLAVHTVKDFDGEPRGAESQLSKWVEFRELNAEDFPAANKVIIDKLKQLD